MNILLTYIDKGGTIVLILIALNIIGFSTVIWKFVQIRLFQKNLSDIENTIRSNINVATNTTHNTIKTEIDSQIFYLDRGMNIIQTIATVAPLLGLLGTVLGVFISFEAVSIKGLGDPSIFANGISIALLTTITGLIVAIPHYIAYNYLVKIIDFQEISLQKNLNI